ncbi:MAG TPA: peptidylprolyl isomerase, partial [Candidatus Sulfotelmatobacter sp.]|nr:peptidylprolyl isomerase [Candidatus Sulfotelmatobacter sp.]
KKLILNSLCVFSLLAFVSVGCSQDNAGSTTNSVAAAVTNQAPALPAAVPAAAGSFDDPTKLTAQAPETFRAKFETTKGAFTVEITRSLSPNGADRFYNLVRSGFFKDIAFFRVLPGFMVQFGIHGDPAVSAKWRGANISDDPVKTTNARGTLTFATAGPGTRTTQLFINYADNAFLDGQGFSPFGKVVEGMDVVDKINSDSAERPDQGEIQGEGNKYLKSAFPNLDYIKSATIVSGGK